PGPDLGGACMGAGCGGFWGKAEGHGAPRSDPGVVTDLGAVGSKQDIGRLAFLSGEGFSEVSEGAAVRDHSREEAVDVVPGRVERVFGQVVLYLGGEILDFGVA